MSLQPKTIEDVQAIVKKNQTLLPVAGGSKSALSTPTNGAIPLDMSNLSGIIEYEPNEYTFTAYAGTPITKVKAALTEHGQYLPFDPLLGAHGATLGGMVAANTAGSGRYRYGGVRDFILGIHFVDGYGQLVRSGGKVVKNSAGFDLPKFMVGSLGRFGVLVDLTFKVFPQPRHYITLKLTYPDLTAALQAIYSLAPTPFEMDALDLEPGDDNEFTLLIRLGGLADALPGRTGRLTAFLTKETATSHSQMIQDAPETELWEAINSAAWGEDGASLIKVPLSPKRIPDLEQQLTKTQRRYSAGGNVAWLSTPDVTALDTQLNSLDLSGLQLIGQPGQPYLGIQKGVALAQRVKQALDPNGKFLAI